MLLKPSATLPRPSLPTTPYSGMALQLAIVLSSAAILAVTLSLFYASLGVGAVGVLLFFFALGA